MKNETHEPASEECARPGMLDLNDWAVTHAPEVYAVAKYLNSAENFCDLLHAAWIVAGKPELEGRGE